MFKNTKQKNLFDSIKGNEKQIVEFDESEWNLITARELLKGVSLNKPQRLIFNEHEKQIVKYPKKKVKT